MSVSAANGTVTLAADADPSLETTVPIWAARQNAALLARRARARGRDRVIRRVGASLPLAVVLLQVTAVAVLLPDIRLALGSSRVRGRSGR